MCSNEMKTICAEAFVRVRLLCMFCWLFALPFCFLSDLPWEKVQVIFQLFPYPYLIVFWLPGKVTRGCLCAFPNTGTGSLAGKAACLVKNARRRTTGRADLGELTYRTTNIT